MKENLLPIGTKVFDIRFGWGEIIDSDRYKVEFKNTIIFYDKYGKTSMTDINPTLSLTEYTLKNGGFTPLSDYNKPKVGDFGYFWDNRDTEKGYLIFSFITDENLFYDSTGEEWENFSKQIPEWFLKKMNK